MSRQRMRMAELVRASGVPRETIHYYAREGLLPPPERSGKTSAYYDERHLERLQLIRRLRDEKYLPVAVIRGIVRAGLEATSGRDLDTLAEVLRIDPTLQLPLVAPARDDEAERVAHELGLLESGSDRLDDPTVGRVLAAVAEALALEGEARALTLEDMRVGAPAIARLVEAEAKVFFDLVLQSGAMPDAVRALRAGRGAVARFIAAYRDLTLRRLVEELLSAIHHRADHVARARTLALSDTALVRLGAAAEEAALAARAKQGDPAAANAWVWHVFAVGSGRELLTLPQGVHGLLRPRAELLVAHARLERGNGDPAALEAMLERAGRFALGEILASEAALVQAGDSREGGVLELAIPALHRLYAAEPARDADPLASAFGHLRRGLLGWVLPAALGRRERALGDLEQALAVVRSAPGRIHPAAAARIEANARLGLGRALAGTERRAEALAHLERARALDPDGPVASAVTALFEPAAGPEILAAPHDAG